MLLRELIRTRVEPDPKTAKFYLGNIFYTIQRWIEILWPVLIAVIIVVIFGRSIYQNPTDLDLIQRGILSIGVFTAVMLISGWIFPSYLYPVVAVTEDFLWFRYLRRWRRLRWSDIQAVRPAKYYAGQLGILIYSEKLPRSFAGNARVYGATKGRAIVVFNLLLQIRELQAEIETHLSPAKQ